VPFTAEMFKPTTTKIKNNNKYVAAAAPAERSLKKTKKWAWQPRQLSHTPFQLSRDYYNTAFLVILLTAKVFIPSKN